MRRGRLAAVITATICPLVVGGAASEAPADPPTSVQVSVSPDVVSWPARSDLTYEVEISSGPAGAEVGVGFSSPLWGGSSGHRTSPIDFGPPQLIGPGTIRPSQQAPTPLVLMLGGCSRGKETLLGYRPWVELPPSVVSTVVIPARLSGLPFGDIAYVARFSTFLEDDPIAPRTSLAVPQVQVAGPTGVRIEAEVSTNRRIRYFKRRSQTPPIAGTTDPPLPRTLVRLRTIPFAAWADGIEEEDWSSHSRKLGRVRTDSRGRFRLSAQASALHGRHAVILRSEAAYGHPADWGCGPLLSLRRPEPKSRRP